MNEFLIYLRTLRELEWVLLGVVFAVSVGFLLFDRPRKPAAIEEADAATERKAA